MGAGAEEGLMSLRLSLVLKRLGGTFRACLAKILNAYTVFFQLNRQRKLSQTFTKPGTLCPQTGQLRWPRYAA